MSRATQQMNAAHQTTTPKPKPKLVSGIPLRAYGLWNYPGTKTDFTCHVTYRAGIRRSTCTCLLFFIMCKTLRHAGCVYFLRNTYNVLFVWDFLLHGKALNRTKKLLIIRIICKPKRSVAKFSIYLEIHSINAWKLKYSSVDNLANGMQVVTWNS